MESYSNMDKNYNICVVGSGPIALFTCWSLRQFNNHVSIVSDRLYLSTNKIRVFLNDKYLPGHFSFAVSPTSDLFVELSDLYILCGTPSRSLAIADQLQSSNPQSKVLILSTYSQTIFDSLSQYSSSRFFAWPLVSVEFDGSSIFATNLLQLLFFRIHDDPHVSTFVDDIFKPYISVSFTSSSKSFIARSILTFALYSFLYDLGANSLELSSLSMCRYCTPLVLKLSALNNVIVTDYPGFSAFLPFEDQLNQLFSELLPSCMSSPASKHNLFFLLSNKTKLKRFMSEFQLF